MSAPIILPGLPGHPFDRVYRRPPHAPMLKSGACIAPLTPFTKTAKEASEVQRKADAVAALALQQHNREQHAAMLDFRLRTAGSKTGLRTVLREARAEAKARAREDRARAKGQILFAVPVYQSHKISGKSYPTHGERAMVKAFKADAITQALDRKDMAAVHELRAATYAEIKATMERAARIAARVAKANKSAGASKGPAR